MSATPGAWAPNNRDLCVHALNTNQARRGSRIPGYEASSLYGIGAPRNTPAEIIDKLNTEVNAALADPKMRARLAARGGTPLPGSPAQFGKLIVDETEKWGKVIKFAGIKPQ